MKRPPIAPQVTALCISDLTCEATFGVPWRPMRRWLESRGIAIPYVGRRPCVPVATILAELDRQVGTTTPTSTPADDAELIARASGRVQ